jgi:putative PEP-CTERM system histidine kinase
VPSGTGLDLAADWQWQGVEVHPGDGSDALLSHLATTRRVIELDAVRRGQADGADAAAVPGWIIDVADAWVVVPLPHGDRLAGIILLARPAIERPLDWEDFDLLKIAGRQVASHLAEARARQALAEAERFDEFNRRFAFILHDIKNLVSQLSLVARNAERHADNPEFRADMVATLNESSGRMNALLAKLSQHHQAKGEPMVPVALHALVESVASRRKGQHPITLSGDTTATAWGDPARIEQIVSHLIQNAIDASAPGEAIILRIGDDGDGVTIDVVDCGSGMSPVFVRDRLFKPFDSTKAGGFGIGAFEARQLASAMRGRLDVHSREGEGTRFRLTLPRAAEHNMEHAA